MKEQLHTIPVNEAFESGDECPFCYLERQVEQRTLRYAIGPGASYMEPEIREITNREGFCREHLKKMYDYGNALGNALILQTWFLGMMQQLDAQMDNYELPEKKGLFRRKKPEPQQEGLVPWMEETLGSCFICKQLEENMDRYYATFYALIKEPEFREKVEKSKGFCMRHFLELMQCSGKYLKDQQRQWFRERVFSVHWENLNRVKDDLDWLIKKYDYQYASADWKNSRDALRRAMQKYQGGHPADGPYKNT